MWIRICAVLCGAGWAALLGCGAPPGERADVAVAQVGQEFIYQTDVETLAGALGPGLRSEETGDAARRDYLQSLIDQKLLVMAARARALDTVATVRNRMAWRFREYVINQYQVQNLNARIQVTDEELNQRFVQGQYGHEKLLSRLVVATLEEATALQRQVEAGADFASLVKVHSLDRQTARFDGRMGYLNRVGAAQSPSRIPSHVFAGLRPGSVAEPLPLADKYQLIYCSHEREAEFARYRKALHENLWKERFVAENRALLEELGASFGLRVHSAGLAVLVAQDPDGPVYPDLSPADAAAPLFVYEGGHITAGRYLEEFRLAQQRPALGDSLQVIRSAWTLPIPKALVWQAAKSTGYLEKEEVRRWKKQKEEDLLILELRKTEIVEQVAIPDAAVVQHYQENRERFREPLGMYVEELLVDELDQANELRRRLDAGETVADLAHLSQRHGAPDSEGKLHVHSYEQGVYGDLLRHATEAEVGQLVGPVQLQAGFSIFRVLERSGGHIRSLEDERKRIGALLRVTEEERRFNVLVDQLRAEYVEEVTIFDDALPQIQLPVYEPPA